MTTQPPVPKYRLTLTIEGNTLDEVEGELLTQTRGGFLMASDYYKRDEWHVVGGRCTSHMEHANPGMTPERYDVELADWHEVRRAERKAKP